MKKLFCIAMCAVLAACGKDDGDDGNGNGNNDPVKVYAVGVEGFWDSENSTGIELATLWTDGAVWHLSSKYSSADGICAGDGGTLYVCGYEYDTAKDTDIATLWTINGTDKSVMPLSSTAGLHSYPNDICESGGVLYIVGNQSQPSPLRTTRPIRLNPRQEKLR